MGTSGVTQITEWERPKNNQNTTIRFFIIRTIAAKIITKILFKRIVLAQLILQKLQNNLFTKQIPSHVLLQTGTNQWQQHCKESVLVELIL